MQELKGWATSCLVYSTLNSALDTMWVRQIISNLLSQYNIKVTIWILNRWIPDSLGVRYSNGKVMWLGRPFGYRIFWTINKLFSVRFSDHLSNTGPLNNWTQIYHLNTRLVQYSDGYVYLKILRRQTIFLQVILSL